LEAKLRKRQDILRITGVAIIVLSLYSLFELVVQYFFNLNYMESVFSRIDSEVTNYGVNFGVLIVAIFLMFDALICIYIGGSAIKESRNKIKGYVYIVVSLIYLLNTISTDYMKITLNDIEYKTDEIIEAVFSSMVIYFTFFELIYSSIMVKVLKRKIGK